MIFFGEIKIGDEWGGSAFETGDFKRRSNKTGKAESRVFWGIFLEIGGFMGLVDDDEAEVMNRGEQSRARADNDKRGFGLVDFIPEVTAGGVGLATMETDNTVTEGALENLD